MSNELAVLLADGVIDEVLGGLKTGKEAEVYLVRHGGEVVAAKLYKERHARSFHHNADYKEGRTVRNTRTQRAMNRGSRFGQAAAEEAWKSAEADALYRLHAAGVRVPTPVMFYEGVLLMELVVDVEGHPAPRLIDARLTRGSAAELYRDLRRQVITMLCGDMIHGDLSAYNVLLGAAGPTIIDFPQIISAAHNSRAEFFFRRDLENLRLHLAAIDPALADSRGDAAEIWRAFVRRDLAPEFVPSGKPPPPEAVRHGDRRPGGQSRNDRPSGRQHGHGESQRQPGHSGAPGLQAGGSRGHPGGGQQAEKKPHPGGPGPHEGRRSRRRRGGGQRPDHGSQHGGPAASAGQHPHGHPGDAQRPGSQRGGPGRHEGARGHGPHHGGPFAGHHPHGPREDGHPPGHGPHHGGPFAGHHPHGPREGGHPAGHGPPPGGPAASGHHHPHGPRKDGQPPGPGPHQRGPAASGHQPPHAQHARGPGPGQGPHHGGPAATAGHRPHAQHAGGQRPCSSPDPRGRDRRAPEVSYVGQRAPAASTPSRDDRQADRSGKPDNDPSSR